MRAEHAPEERLVAPNPWATLGSHVVASPASHGALEGGGLSVGSFYFPRFWVFIYGRKIIASLWVAAWRQPSPHQRRSLLPQSLGLRQMQMGSARRSRAGRCSRHRCALCRRGYT